MIESYGSFRFGQTVARDLLDNHHVLTHGRSYKRRDIVRLLVERFLERGGTQEGGPHDPARAMKKLFPGKEDRSNERFERLAFGMYRYIGQGSGNATGPTAAPSHDANADPLTPDDARGKGAYEVYAWCLPQDEGTGDHWPIKIGYAGEGGFCRRWQQDFATHLPMLPRYLRSFRHETEAKARKTERYLHDMLGDDGRRRRVQGVPGTEWFLTSPDEIDQLMRHRSPHLFTTSSVVRKSRGGSGTASASARRALPLKRRSG